MILVPPTLVREQLPAITGMTTGLLWSFIPAKAKKRFIDTHATQYKTVQPSSAKLIEHYKKWMGAEPQRYQGVLPPHFFAKYGMNLVAKLTGQAPYNMLSVVNQGCRLQINACIPQDEPIHLSGQLVSCTEDGPRVRVHTRVDVSTTSIQNAMTVDTVAVVMLGKPAAKTKTVHEEPHFETIGQWSEHKYSGVEFFYLTGDYNPIHTLWPVARHSRFGGCILHGFGSLGRSFESLQNAGFKIKDFDTRFIKPNVLPEVGDKQLAVQVSAEDEDGYRHMRLIDAQQNVYLAGRFA